MVKKGFKVDSASKAFLLVLVLIVGLWLVNSQRPIAAELTDTVLLGIGALTVWGSILSAQSFRNPAIGFMGGFITYIGLLYVVLGMGI